MKPNMWSLHLSYHIEHFHLLILPQHAWPPLVSAHLPPSFILHFFILLLGELTATRYGTIEMQIYALYQGHLMPFDTSSPHALYPGGSLYCQVEHHVRFIYILHKASPEWVKIVSNFYMSRYTRYLLHSKKW